MPRRCGSSTSSTYARHDGGVWVLTASDGGAAELAEFGITPV